MANEMPALARSLGVKRTTKANTQLNVQFDNNNVASKKNLHQALPAQPEFSAFPSEGKAETAKI